jgi:biotin operon repressor
MNQNDANRTARLINVSRASPPNKAGLAALLERHVGLDLAIISTDIAVALGCDEHLVHSLVAQLRDDGIAICRHQERGYFIAAKSAELEEACAALRSRAMQTLAVEAKLRHLPLPRLIDLLWLEGAKE